MISVLKIKEIYRNEEFPSIKDLISEKEPQDKDKILNYLKRGEVVAVAAERATDLITGKTIDGELFCYTDGKYTWRSDTIYYFEKYNIELPKKFVYYVLNK